MARVLARWRGLTLYSYATFLYIGLVVALIVADLTARAWGLPAPRVFVGVLLLIPTTLIGARGLFVVLNWALFSRRETGLMALPKGGGDMFGGLPVALLCSVPIVMVLDLPFARFWDIGAVAILAGMIPTRFGCLLNGCCGGRPTQGPLGFELTNYRGERVRRIPMQMIEALWTAIVLTLGLWLTPHLPFDGALFLILCLGYSIGRVSLDRLREEPQPWLRGLSVHQGIYGGFGLLCLVLLVIGLVAHSTVG